MRSQRMRAGIGLGGAALLLLLILVPNQQQGGIKGSTYGRAPEGYGAWSAYMAQRGTPVQRWQKPLGDFSRVASGSVARPKGGMPPAPPKTLLVIAPPPQQPAAQLLTPEGMPTALGQELLPWVKQGHRLVVVGMPGTVTAGAFASQHPTPRGGVQIHTTRRQIDLAPVAAPQSAQRSAPQSAQPSTQPAPKPPPTILLADSRGAIAWKQRYGEGEIIAVIPEYLAANAYQQSPGNFAWLAELAGAGQAEIWVDEYSHGYRDPETQRREGRDSLWGYLARTPLVLVLIQIGVGVAIAVWGQRRWGPVLQLTTPELNNSEAYIQALASVLQRSKSDRFVLEQLLRAERQALQHSLGLGSATVSDATLIQVWQQRTGQSAQVLEPLLRSPKGPKETDHHNLKTTLQALQSIRHHLEQMTQPHSKV